jgi:branched-chain amino acid aminotransferase
MRRFEVGDFGELAERMRRPFHANYYAMYSSVYGGIVTDPALMLVPVDDHVVHRGDGVFETFKCVDGSFYNMAAHVERLARSAEALGIALPASREEVCGLCIETARAGKRRACSVRVLLSRGPGSFGVNPYDCPAPQLYVAAYHLPAPFLQTHPGGAAVVTTSIPLKAPALARVKTCNYLPNVMMKKECVDQGGDFAVAFDERGYLAEGAVENAGIVTADGRLRFPGPERILRGTTADRVMELAGHLVRQGELRAAEVADIPRAEVQAAAEMLVVGTTIDVVPAVTLDGRKIGEGKPGPVARALLALLQEDMRSNRSLLTPVF